MDNSCLQRIAEWQWANSRRLHTESCETLSRELSDVLFMEGHLPLRMACGCCEAVAIEVRLDGPRMALQPVLRRRGQRLN